MFKRTAMAAAVLLLLVLSGCASVKIGLDAGNVKSGTRPRISEGQALVYGRVIIFEDGVKQVPFGALDEPYLTVVELATGEKSRGLTTLNDGWFFWTLPAGPYYIPYITYRNFTLKPKTAFQAPEASKVYYLGELVIDYTLKTTPRNLIILDVLKTRVEDKYDDSLLVFREKLAGFDVAAAKALMFHDGEFPKDPLIPPVEDLTGVLKKHGITLDKGRP